MYSCLSKMEREVLSFGLKCDIDILYLYSSQANNTRFQHNLQYLWLGHQFILLIMSTHAENIKVNFSHFSVSAWGTVSLFIFSSVQERNILTLVNLKSVTIIFVVKLFELLLHTGKIVWEWENLEYLVDISVVLVQNE